jgi:hypothetical protein
MVIVPISFIKEISNKADATVYEDGPIASRT